MVYVPLLVRLPQLPVAALCERRVGLARAVPPVVQSSRSVELEGEEGVLEAAEAGPCLFDGAAPAVVRFTRAAELAAKTTAVTA